MDQCVLADCLSEVHTVTLAYLSAAACIIIIQLWLLKAKNLVTLLEKKQQVLRTCLGIAVPSVI